MFKAWDWRRWPWSPSAWLTCRINTPDGPELFRVPVKAIVYYQNIGVPLVIEEAAGTRWYLTVTGKDGKKWTK